MGRATPPLPEGVRTVREPRTDMAGLPLHPVPAWTAAYPWLVHGTTGAAGPEGPGEPAHDEADGTDPADLGLFGHAASGRVLARWRTLREALGVPRAVHSRQVHGAAITEHMERLPGLFIGQGRDGHVTGYPGILLTVSVADCVPIFLVEEALHRIALLHGGWRGTTAGVVEAGVDALGGDPHRVLAHLGPAICGECYEVGPEVHEALGLERPTASEPVDLRAIQARRLVDAGVAPDRITVSEHCTRHDPGFFSHRGGSPCRQIGLLGVRWG